MERAEFEAEIASLIARSSEPLVAGLSDLRLDPSELDARRSMARPSSSRSSKATQRLRPEPGPGRPSRFSPGTGLSKGPGLTAGSEDGPEPPVPGLAAPHQLERSVVPLEPAVTPDPVRAALDQLAACGEAIAGIDAREAVHYGELSG